MIVVNFTHPLTDEQKIAVEVLVKHSITRVIDIVTQIDNDTDLAVQVVALVDQVKLSAAEWQTLPMLINPPAYAPVAVTLLAEIHGRIGYFPSIIRVRPQAGSLVTQYEVAEIINLQTVRDVARTQRT